MLRRPSWIFLAVPALTLATPLAWGAEQAEGRTNLFGGDLVISLCTLATFALVVVVLARFAWTPLLTALQNREKFIRDSLAAAKRDREEAEARLREYEQKLAQAHEEASSLLEEGRRDADIVKRQIEGDARTHAEGVLERAKREIDAARDGALQELHEQSAQLAMTMAQAVLKRQLSPEDHRRLVTEALAELSRTPASEQ